MKVLSEEKLCAYLTRVLDLSSEVVGLLPERGTQQVTDEHLDRFHEIVNHLNTERGNDSFLNDESWNWIWESKSTLNYIRLYGRLAWMNLQLLELL